MNTNSGRLTRLSPVILAVAAALLVAACGSSSSSGSSSGSSKPTTTASTSRTQLAACLKKYGVTLPSRRGGFAGGAPGTGTGAAGAPPTGSGTRPPGSGFFGGGGFRSSKFQKAFKACGAKFGRFGAGPGRFRSGHFRVHFSTAILDKFVTCVRKHGYDLPKPNTSGRGAIFSRSIESNKKFQAASRSCATLLRPTTSTSTTPSS